MSSLTDLRVFELLDSLESDERAPGGGAAAALVVAVGASLVRMAARCSRDSWDGASAAAAQAHALRSRVAPMADLDAEALSVAVAALRGAREGGVEVAGEPLGDALDRAAALPLSIAEAGADVAELAALVAERARIPM